MKIKNRELSNDSVSRIKVYNLIILCAKSALFSFWKTFFRDEKFNAWNISSVCAFGGKRRNDVHQSTVKIISNWV